MKPALAIIIASSLLTFACSNSPTTQDASTVDAGCDPRGTSFDAAPANDASKAADSGEIDLDSGTTGEPGHFICYVDLGGDALVTNCTGSLTCCNLKNECYDPTQEPSFCLRPYCQ